jgi:integrase
MRTGVVAKRCSCGSFWRNGAHRCRRCGSTRFASWGFYVDTHPKGATERRKTVRSAFLTKDAAERELLRLLTVVQTGTYASPSKLTLEGYLHAWLAGKTHLRQSTHETYGILIECYVCNPDYGIGTAPLWSLTRPGIKHFYTELERRGRVRGEGPMHPKAVHNVHLVLRKALEDAVEDGLIPANPARRAHKLAVRRPEMKTWTEAEVATFLADVREHRLHALWRTAATTGMRRGEVLALTWPGFDPITRRLHVTQALVKGPRGGPPRFGPPKTDRGRRAVPLDPETVRVLQEHRRLQLEERKTAGDTYQDRGLIFCRPDGRPLDPDVVTHTFGRLAVRAGLPVIRLHDLRHTFATLSLKAGIPTEVVSRILGHRNPVITQVFYQHAVPCLEEDAIARFAALVDGSKAA